MQPLIIIPTYNERENLPELLRAILATVPDMHVLIVDDHSPDGTGELADDLSTRDNRIRVMHRAGKLGLGTAYIAGFKLALSHNFDLIFEMDADFSHDPRYLPRFLDAARSAELVIGSRYIPGGTTPNWSALRRFVSRGGNTFSRAVLQLPVHDCTSGFRCYHRSALEAVDLDAITSQGYAFQVAMVYQVLKQGMRVAEIPITFVDRRVGKSKMSKKIFFEAFRYVVGERLRSGSVPRSSSGRVRVLPPLAADTSATPAR